MSQTEGTALLFEPEWLLYPAFGFPPVPTYHLYTQSVILKELKSKKTAAVN